MRILIALRTLGSLLLVASVAVLPAILVSLWYADGEAADLIENAVAYLVLGMLLWWPLRGRRIELRRRDGFLVVCLMWVLFSAIASVPFVEGLDLSITDALFESISAVTTTGATVLQDVDQIPKSLLFWRQELQWIGGIGIIVAALAILPLLGTGGMQLYLAETPGPMKDAKILPRIQNTARALLIVYVALTALNALAYWLAGMTPFDAITHAFSTISTGGFSTHDESIAYFQSTAVEIAAVVFMLVGGTSFSLHFLALQRRSLRPYGQSSELSVYIAIVTLVSLIVAAILWGSESYSDPASAWITGLFETVSVITSTGYGIDDFSVWPLFLPFLLITISFIGGCAGSTAGGLKVMRVQVLARQGMRDLRRLIHPHSVQPLRVVGRPVPESVISGIWGFFALYVLIFVVALLLLLIDGVDQVTAFGAVATTLNNLGPGLGTVATSFSLFSPEAKWLMDLTMLLGRLEIFPILILLSRSFWVV